MATAFSQPASQIAGQMIAANILKPQKSFAAAFAVLAFALAGCASGLGVTAAESAPSASVSRVDEGVVIASRAASTTPGHAYTVRLRNGELVNLAQAGATAVANGTPVLVEYGERARVIPQNPSIAY